MKEIGKTVHCVKGKAGRDSSLHVIPANGRWEVRSSSATRASRVCDTSRYALAYARARQAVNGSSIYVHGKDGRIDHILMKDGRKL